MINAKVSIVVPIVVHVQHDEVSQKKKKKKKK